MFLGFPVFSQAQDTLCDPGAESCRDILINYIRNESVAIDVAFWFMEDARYTTELINKKKAGVPIRVLIDTRANTPYPLNAERVKELEAAGIPIRRASSSYYLHWKMMLFSGQNIVQFSGANYSADAWRPATATPYENYTDEVIYFTGDPAIVNSFRTKYDDLWVNTSRLTNYANVSGPLTRSYDTYPIDPELNFPPHEGYRTRAVSRYNAEKKAIDVIMYRVLDGAHTDAMIAAVARGVPVRLITEPAQYREPTRLWHSYNIDRMYMGGIQIKHRAHAGLNHQKSVLLHEQRMAIFGSSNWTQSSHNGQYEHNMFTTRPHIYDWLVTQFERKWNNSGGIVENVDFAPLPPDAPNAPQPVNLATGTSTSAVTLSWYGGPWAHKYDVYLGTTTNPERIAQDLQLGPSESSTQRQQYALTTTLVPGTTYYWRVVGKTMANMEKSSELWSFTTEGTAPPPLPPPVNGELGPGDILLHASKAVHAGTWGPVSDGSAAGASAMFQPDAGAAKISSPSANPANYFELSFNANQGTAYRLWIRARAYNDRWANDSVHIQFSGSVTSSGAPQWRIGTTSGTEMNLEDCSGCGLSGWGWQDNGWGVGVLGPLVYFDKTGPQTIRIQTREDGLRIDQIMLSPSKFLSASPGAVKNDTTIYPESDTTAPPPPPPPSVTVLRQPYLQQVTPTSAIVAWTTREAGPAEVVIHRSGNPSQTISATSDLFTTTTTGMAVDYYQHVARIGGLSPSTVYQYDIVVGGIDANAATDSLKTAPSGVGSPVTFVAFGDSGTGSTEQRQVNDRLKADTFDFALHGGDVAYGASNGHGDATYQTLDDWFFAVYRDWLRSRPMFPSMGNHDSSAANQNGRPYRDAFVLPENGASSAYPDHAERYYSFDYGPVHVVVLDTELAFQDVNRRAEQIAWLRADLGATTKPWKVAAFHRSPYSSGGEHGSDLAVRGAFAPVFEEFGVQLVISAHEHTYERTKPIGGVTYVVAGGGGGPLYAAGISSFTAASASRHHYVRGTATECTLKIDAIGTDGSVFDTATLDRCAVPDTTPPTASITAPADGATVAGSVSVGVSASDDIAVVAVELLVDGSKVDEDTTAPFAFTWDSRFVTNATHTLQVRARDAAGNTGDSGVIAVQVNNVSTGSSEIVLHAGKAQVFQGAWIKENDSTAASGLRMRHPNAGAAKRSAALANPGDYFELTFEVQANVPYHLWVRGKADNNHWANDSIFVQFSSGTAYTIGTTNAVEVNLEDCSGCKLSGWGWQDNGWGVGVAGPHITFTSGGVKTLRVQSREDGFAIDQIVLSPTTYLTASPGALKNDTTILPESNGAGGGGGGGEPPPPDTTAPAAQVLSPADGDTVTGTVNVEADASDNVAVTRVDLLVDDAVIGTDTGSPYEFSWNTTTFAEGSHTLHVVAADAAGNAGASAPITVTVNNATLPPDNTDPTVAITAPASGATVSGMVTVNAAASDNVGVAQVELLVDAVPLASDDEAPFSFLWDTTKASAGAHTLQARATDAAGNSGVSASVPVTVDNSSAPAQEVVLYAADASKVAGKWGLEQDAGAAGGWIVRHPNEDARRVSTAQANPADYVEFTFQAEANVPYHLWIRGRADGNGWGNDSVHVQFSGATDYAIGTSSAAMVNLEDCSGCGLSGWGWQDNGYGANQAGADIYFNDSGPQTLRIQTREDGLSIDQIVLSAAEYLTESPGALKDDTTIVEK